MPTLLGQSGGSSDIGLSSPNLDGNFIPSIDNPNFVDGFGTVVPWGGGATTRVYSDYNMSSVGQSAEGSSLIGGFGGGGGGNITYNLEGLVGPQGAAGPMGPQGAQGIPGTAFFDSNFLTSLGVALEGINSVWGQSATADTLLYASETRIYWDITWEKLDIDATVSAWNDTAMDGDGSFIVIAADDGIFVSTDTGENWTKKTPDVNAFITASCSASTGRAVVLDDVNRLTTKFWSTTDSGANWSEITITY